jgi:hypothetical protein
VTISKAKARQVAFAKLAHLFTDLIMNVPIDGKTTFEQNEEASRVLKQEYAKIMDQYDRDKRHASDPD